MHASVYACVHECVYACVREYTNICFNLILLHVHAYVSRHLYLHRSERRRSLSIGNRLYR